MAMPASISRAFTGNDAKPILPPSLRPAIAVVALFAALMLAALSAIYATGNKLGAFDGREPDRLRPPLLDAAIVIDFGGERIGAAALLVILVTGCVALRRPRMAVLAVTGPALTVVVTAALKQLVGRKIHGDYLAFPSGHTGFATAFVFVLALLVAGVLQTSAPVRLLVLLVAAVTAGAAMAWSQVALSTHYPTDTLGGFCAALAVVPAAAWLIDRIARHGSVQGLDSRK